MQRYYSRQRRYLGKQSLVIVNRGNAKPHEVVALAKYIMAEVLNKFNIKLEPEVRTYGSKEKFLGTLCRLFKTSQTFKLC